MAITAAIFTFEGTILQSRPAGELASGQPLEGLEAFLQSLAHAGIPLLLLASEPSYKLRKKRIKTIYPEEEKNE